MIRRGEPGYWYLLAYYKWHNIIYSEPVYWTGKVITDRFDQLGITFIPELRHDRKIAAQYGSVEILKIMADLFEDKNAVIMGVRFLSSAQRNTRKDT